MVPGADLDLYDISPVLINFLLVLNHENQRFKFRHLGAIGYSRVR